LEYADDTLLFARTSDTMNRLLHLVEKHSAYYGMLLNQDKTYLINMNPPPTKNPYTAPPDKPIIHYRNGDKVPTKLLVTYLGVDVETAEKLFQALLVLILGQGIADIKK